jgi:hypothetical protein
LSRGALSDTPQTQRRAITRIACRVFRTEAGLQARLKM